MMGGTDIVIPGIGDSAGLDNCVQLVQHYWPSAKFEDAITGEKYQSYGEIPLGHVRELFMYRNAAAEIEWDADSTDSPPNSMLYLIGSPGSITIVLDDPNTAEMQSILKSMQSVLNMDILNTYAEAA
jgi:hypothetical protein